MSRRQVRLSGLLLAFLLGVFVTRVFYGAKGVKAGNEERFIIQNDSVYYSPNGGDTVTWTLASNPSKTVYIHFKGSSPCANKLLDIAGQCAIGKRAGGTFLYYCTDSPTPGTTGVTNYCTDPGLDPNSDTGAQRVNLPVGTDVLSPGPTQPGGTGTPRPTTAMAGVAGATGTGTANTTTLVVACQGSNLVVLNGTAAVTPSSYPSVSIGDTVQWDSDADINASVAFDHADDCTGRFDLNPAYCRVNKTPTTYKVSGICKGKAVTPISSGLNVK